MCSNLGKIISNLFFFGFSHLSKFQNNDIKQKTSVNTQLKKRCGMKKNVAVVFESCDIRKGRTDFIFDTLV